jgi:hypothetical protein
MSEKIRRELDRWEDRSKRTIQKLKKVSGRVSKELREEYKKLRADGIELVKEIDKQLAKVKIDDKTRDALRRFRNRAKKATKELVDAWIEAEEEPIYPITLPIDYE